MLSDLARFSFRQIIVHHYHLRSIIHDVGDKRSPSSNKESIIITIMIRRARQHTSLGERYLLPYLLLFRRQHVFPRQNFARHERVSVFRVFGTFRLVWYPYSTGRINTRLVWWMTTTITSLSTPLLCTPQSSALTLLQSYLERI